MKALPFDQRPWMKAAEITDALVGALELTLANMPIARFRHALEREHRFDDYMQLLRDNFLSPRRVREWRGDVIFLHEVAPGAADRSYGIQVAKLAGLPAPVIAFALRSGELQSFVATSGRSSA